MDSTRRITDWLPTYGTPALLLSLAVTAIIASTGRNDLDIYSAASADFLSGVNMYTRKYFDGFSYFYSPFFTLAISPLASLGMVAAKLVWSTLMLGALWRCWRIAEIVLLKDTAKRERQLILFFTLAATFQAARDNLNSSQVTFFVLWFCLEGLYRIGRGQWAFGALLLAFGIDMKLIPLVLLPYLIYRKEWKPALLTCLFVVALQWLPGIVIGWEAEAGLLHARWTMIDPNDARHILDEEEPSTIALGSMISAYFSTEGGNSHTLALPRNIAPLSLDTIKLILLAGRALLVLIALWFLRWPPFTPASDQYHAWWEVSYLLLCTVLLFPHQRNYSLMLAAPSVVWMVWYVIVGPGSITARNWRWWLPRYALLIGMNLDLLMGEFAPLYNHYKLFSFITIGLIALLMASRPSYATVAKE